MLKLRIIQAEYGDCFILGSGTDGTERFILIDGGPKDIYQAHLRGELGKLGERNTPLDLVMLSHVDTDHIIGLLDLFAELREQENEGQDRLVEVKGLWFNSFSAALDRGSGLAGALLNTLTGVAGINTPNTVLGLNGIGEGNRLRIAALLLGIPINDGFPDDLITVDEAPNPIQMDDLSLHVVGPTKKNLNELQTKWQTWLTDHAEAFATGIPNLLANADRSIPNLSSIMVLAEEGGRTILFTGDGRGDHLYEGLGAAGLLDDDGKLHVDVLKVAHHGSDRNATKTFHRKVTADTYVISANEHPNNPDLTTLGWIVETAKEANRPIRLMVTNKTESITQMPLELPEADFTYTLDIMPDHYHYWDLELPGVVAGDA